MIKSPYGDFKMDTYLKSPIWGRKTLTIFVGIGLLMTILPVFGPGAQKEDAQFLVKDKLLFAQDNALLPVSDPTAPDPKVVSRVPVIVTAYSSSVWETDSDPFVTAAGTWVRDGIVANNLLPFGTKVRMPEIYGDKIFVVEDRMNRKKGNYHFDVWFPSYWEAKEFGAQQTYIEILEG
ncbi:MAG: 3D domain-containing protein [bacterium]|nr:3D domain-containing protein [bacterium]